MHIGAQKNGAHCRWRFKYCNLRADAACCRDEAEWKRGRTVNEMPPSLALTVCRGSTGPARLAQRRQIVSVNHLFVGAMPQHLRDLVAPQPANSR